MNLNKVELIGNLTADPQVKELPSGSALARFSVATRYDWKDSKTKERKHDVEYHTMVAHGKLAQVVAKYLKKRDKVYIDGRLRTVRWEDKSGNRRSRTEVIAVNLIMLGQPKQKTPEAENDEVVVEEIDADENGEG